MELVGGLFVGELDIIVTPLESPVLLQHVQCLDLLDDVLAASNHLLDYLGVSLMLVLEEGPLESLPEVIIAHGVLTTHVQQVLVQLDHLRS